MLKTSPLSNKMTSLIRVKPDEKILIYKTTEISNNRENLSDQWKDYNVDQNLNDNLLDLDPYLDNSQMSAFLMKFTEGQKNERKEQKSAANNYKPINGSGFYSCKSCPFLCLNATMFMEHNTKEHNYHHAPLQSLLKTKCIGCENTFYSVNVLRCHLIEDHHVLSIEVGELVQLVIDANHDERVYNDNISQTQIENNYLAHLNDTMCNTTELDQRSYIVDTQNQITGENNFIGENCHSNETFDEFWENQEHVLKGTQECNPQNDTMTIDKKLRCTYNRLCKARFTNEDNLKYHTKCHFEDKFRCIECKFTNKKWLPMMSHLWKTHNIDIEMFSCNQCQFKTNSLYKLNTFHKNIHSEEKSFLCTECNKGFKSIKQLRNHKVIHTKIGKPPRTDQSCSTCSKIFPSKTLLYRHITSVHIRAQLYKCKYCSYTTSVFSSLKLHMRSHTGEKPFKCDECDFLTADHNTLRKHKMRHTGKKDYTCTLCGYSCIQTATFKKHLKNKHPGIDYSNLYSCDLCNFKTFRSDLFMVHVVKHNEEAIVENGICVPILPLEEIFIEKEKIQAEIKEKEKNQAEINEKSYHFNTIRVKPLNSLKSNEVITNNNN